MSKNVWFHLLKFEFWILCHTIFQTKQSIKFINRENIQEINLFER